MQHSAAKQLTNDFFLGRREDQGTQISGKISFANYQPGIGPGIPVSPSSANLQIQCIKEASLSHNVISQAHAGHVNIHDA